MFMQRPEEPTEWAGLPGEPLVPTAPSTSVDADELPDALALVEGGAVASVEIPVDPRLWDIAGGSDSGGDGD